MRRGNVSEKEIDIILTAFGRSFIYNSSTATRNMSTAIEYEIDLPIFDNSTQVKSSVLIAIRVDSLVLVLYTHH